MWVDLILYMVVIQLNGSNVIINARLDIKAEQSFSYCFITLGDFEQFVFSNVLRNCFLKKTRHTATVVTAMTAEEHVLHCPALPCLTALYTATACWVSMTFSPQIFAFLFL